MIRGKNIKSDLLFLAKLILNPIKKKVYYLGYVGYGNLGDEALKEAIFQLFCNSFIFSPSRGALIRLLEKIGVVKFDILMLGGGTLVLRSEDILTKMSDNSIHKRVIFGTGVANHIFWKDVAGNYGDKSKWVQLLNGVQYLSVRGPISYQSLSKIGVSNKVKVIGDPVLYFIRPIESKKSKSKKLGVNIGTTRSGNKKDFLWGRDEELFFSKFINFINLMLASGWTIEFVPMCKEDEVVIVNLLIKHDMSDKVGVFKSFDSTKKSIDRLEQFDVFIGQKLHSTILAYCANTPAVMVEYRPKCRDFMASINMEEYNIRTDEFTDIKGKALVEKLYDNLETHREAVNKRCSIYKDKLIKAAGEVISLT